MPREAEIAKLIARFGAMRATAARAAQELSTDERALFGAAIAFRISGDYPAALAQFERLNVIAPGNTHYLFELGRTQEYLGQFDAAVASYNASLEAEPLNYQSLRAVVALQKQSALNNRVPELERQLTLADDDGWRSLHLGHALAKTYEDFGDTQKSFQWLTRAKKKRRQLFPHSAQEDEARAQAVRQLRLSAGEGENALEPIFVTGLPRSGTTLADRIISSHRDVTSAGEISNFVQLLKFFSDSTTPITLDVDMLSRAGDVDFARLGRSYIDSTRPLTGATPRFIDKAPSNFLLAPIILRALPNARIIVMRRHPLDSVLSNYKQIFPFDDRYYDYVYDLEWTAQKFVVFDRLITHWREVLPADRFMVLQYEDLVANQEARTRDLLAFCGLEWDARTLSFHKNAAGVATPSARQVRQPMNTQAVGRWEKYGAALDPARRVLEAAGISLA
ncbi:MAG: tetratricopeptide repeat-containing sulfotransferase family protein [Terricaulis sp.]